MKIDQQQTKYIAEHPELFHELNPILGTHPSVGYVNGYFTVVMIVHPILACAMAQPYRLAFQLGTIGLEEFVTWRNHKIGVKP